MDIGPEVIVLEPEQDPPVATLAETCGMAFDPDPSLKAATEYAVVRWSAATGCDIRVEEGGIPVYAHDHFYAVDEPDREICGLATWAEDESGVIRLDVSLACGVEDTVTHEVGHAIAGWKRHSFAGVMAAGEDEDRTGVIDLASLEMVCYHFPCAVLNPEQ